MSNTSCCDDDSLELHKDFAELNAVFTIDSAKDKIQDEEDIPSDQQHKHLEDRKPVSRARDDTQTRVKTPTAR